jgi:hypothetical protein
MNCAEDIQVSHVGKCNIGNYCNLVVMLWTQWNILRR